MQRQTSSASNSIIDADKAKTLLRAGIDLIDKDPIQSNKMLRIALTLLQQIPTSIKTDDMLINQVDCLTFIGKSLLRTFRNAEPKTLPEKEEIINAVIQLYKEALNLVANVKTDHTASLIRKTTVLELLAEQQHSLGILNHYCENNANYDKAVQAHLKAIDFQYQLLAIFKEKAKGRDTYKDAENTVLRNITLYTAHIADCQMEHASSQKDCAMFEMAAMTLCGIYQDSQLYPHWNRLHAHTLFSCYQAHLEILIEKNAANEISALFDKMQEICSILPDHHTLLMSREIAQFFKQSLKLLIPLKPEVAATIKQVPLLLTLGFRLQEIGSRHLHQEQNTEFHYKQATTHYLDALTVLNQTLALLHHEVEKDTQQYIDTSDKIQGKIVECHRELVKCHLRFCYPQKKIHALKLALNNLESIYKNEKLRTYWIKEDLNLFFSCYIIQLEIYNTDKNFENLSATYEAMINECSTLPEHQTIDLNPFRHAWVGVLITLSRNATDKNQQKAYEEKAVEQQLCISREVIIPNGPKKQYIFSLFQVLEEKKQEKKNDPETAVLTPQIAEPISKRKLKKKSGQVYKFNSHTPSKPKPKPMVAQPSIMNTPPEAAPLEIKSPIIDSQLPIAASLATPEPENTTITKTEPHNQRIKDRERRKHLARLANRKPKKKIADDGDMTEPLSPRIIEPNKTEMEKSSSLTAQSPIVQAIPAETAVHAVELISSPATPVSEIVARAPSPCIIIDAKNSASAATTSPAATSAETSANSSKNESPLLSDEQLIAVSQPQPKPLFQSNQLRDAIPEEVRTIFRKFKAHGLIYFVGGCVRDWLLGYIPKDIDATSNISPKILQQLGAIKHDYVPDLYVLQQGPLRYEILYVKNLNLLQSAWSRDITLNANFCDDQGNFWAPLYENYQSAILDIFKRNIRIIGIDPVTSLATHPERILRIIELVSRKPNDANFFQVDAVATEVIRQCAPYIQHIPQPQLKYLVSSMLLNGNACANFSSLLHYGAAQYLFPSINTFIQTPHVFALIHWIFLQTDMAWLVTQKSGTAINLDNPTILKVPLDIVALFLATAFIYHPESFNQTAQLTRCFPFMEANISSDRMQKLNHKISAMMPILGEKLYREHALQYEVTNHYHFYNPSVTLVQSQPVPAAATPTFKQ